MCVLHTITKSDPSSIIAKMIPQLPINIVTSLVNLGNFLSSLISDMEEEDSLSTLDLDMDAETIYFFLGKEADTTTTQDFILIDHSEATATASALPSIAPARVILSSNYNIPSRT